MSTRSKPASRFCPHFNQKALEGTIREAGLQYRWRGETLGGFSTGARMADTLDGLIQWADDNPTRLQAWMCAERPQSDCHRFYWLARYVMTVAPQQTIRSLTVHSPDLFPTLADFETKQHRDDWAAAPWLQQAIDAKREAGLIPKAA